MFKLRPLPYALDALEPYISTHIMEIHYEKLHQGYVNRLNKALEAHPELYKKSVEWFLATPNQIPAAIRTEVMRGAGGDYNHAFFWAVMKKGGGGVPNGELAMMIQKYFGDFETFKKKFSAVANGVFGSGWAWLCLNKNGDLELCESGDQDVTITTGLQPLLCLDVWEHAYFLQYENRRAEYVENWWHLVNWEAVEENYRMIVK